MRLTGGTSGFRTVRDLILFVVGLGLLIFGGGLAGAPSVLKFDEKKEKE